MTVPGPEARGPFIAPLCGTIAAWIAHRVIRINIAPVFPDFGAADGIANCLVALLGRLVQHQFLTDPGLLRNDSFLAGGCRLDLALTEQVFAGRYRTINRSALDLDMLVTQMDCFIDRRLDNIAA